MEQVTTEDNTSDAGSETILLQQESKTISQPEEDVATISTTTQGQPPPSHQQQPPQQQQLLLPMSDFRVPPELQIPLIVLVCKNTMYFFFQWKTKCTWLKTKPAFSLSHTFLLDRHHFLYFADCIDRFSSHTWTFIRIGTKNKAKSKTQ